MSIPHSLWRFPEPLLLASTSPTRRGLLERAGIPVETRAPGVDERAVEAEVSGGDPEALAIHLARAKALAVSRRAPGRLVLGADQTLACEGQLFHKPANRAGALAQLERLAGRTHSLHSGAALARDGEVLQAFAGEARLTLRSLSRGALELYLDAAGEVVMGSVGVYRVEELGLHLFEEVEGDHSTILGLPLLPLLAHLRALGALAI